MKKLTRAEEEIMHIVWELGSCTVGDIRSRIEEKEGKKPPHSTISTVLRILSDKGFLTYEAFGRTHVYHPAVTKEEYSAQSLDQLVSDYFGGSADRLVSFLVKREDLSLDELSDLLQQLDKDDDE